MFLENGKVECVAIDMSRLPCMVGVGGCGYVGCGWVWSGRGANVRHEVGIKFRHKMLKSASDSSVSSAHTHAAHAHVNNKSIWKIAQGRRRKHAVRAKKCRGRDTP